MHALLISSRTQDLECVEIFSGVASVVRGFRAWTDDYDSCAIHDLLQNYSSDSFRGKAQPSMAKVALEQKRLVLS